LRFVEILQGIFFLTISLLILMVVSFRLNYVSWEELQLPVIAVTVVALVAGAVAAISDAITGRRN
jgi:uncharacterized integral membrane protein